MPASLLFNVPWDIVIFLNRCRQDEGLRFKCDMTLIDGAATFQHTVSCC